MSNLKMQIVGDPISTAKNDGFFFNQGKQQTAERIGEYIKSNFDYKSFEIDLILSFIEKIKNEKNI